MVCSQGDCIALVHVSGLCKTHYSRAHKKGEQPWVMHYTLPDGTRRICSQLECDRPIKCRGLCQLHYERVIRAGNPKKQRRSRWTNADGSRMLCMEAECENPIKVAGRCSVHYNRDWRSEKRPNTNTVCPTPGCGRPMIARSSICGVCNQARWRYGLDLKRFLEMRQPENMKCGNPGCNSVERLHIDHDHNCCPPGAFTTRTQVSCGLCIRGWLCQTCNTSLGMLGESRDRIQGLLDYLEKSRTPGS